ncbi:ALP1-like protein isoform X1 [Tanacetum coccineum]
MRLQQESFGYVIAHLLKPRDWKSPVRQQFFLDCNDSSKRISSEPGDLKLRAPIKIFGDLLWQFGDLEFLRKLTQTDVEKLYAFREEKHGFPGMLGIDCTDWDVNNDVNILRQSPLFNDLEDGKAPKVPFVANDVTYKCGYYLTDGDISGMGSKGLRPLAGSRGRAPCWGPTVEKNSCESWFQPTLTAVI